MYSAESRAVGAIHPLAFRLVQAYRTLGGRRLLRVLPQWLVRQEYVVLVRDLGQPLPEIPPHQPLRWTQLTEAEIPRLRAINPALSDADIHRRLREGAECVLCWIGNALAHYWWETARPAHLPYLRKNFLPLEGDIYVGEAFTHRAFRGQGITTATAIVALHRARDRGFSRSIGITAWWNAPSLRVSWQRTGRTLAGTVGCWRVGPWRRYFVTGDVHFDGDTSISVAKQPRRADLMA